MQKMCPIEFIRLAELLSDKARQIAVKFFRQNLTINIKSDHSPVTNADLEIETIQRKLIQKTYPEHGINGEEFNGTQLNADYVWVLDPIDGTQAFANGIPVFTNLIGLMHKGKPVLGVVDQPILGERWIGAMGRGTSLNGNPVRTSEVKTLADTTLHATTPEMFGQENTYKRFDTLSNLTRYRRYGTDCYAYGLLASGHLHLIAEAELKVQDYLPVIEVVRQAGGCISDWSGRNLSFDSDGTVLASANSELHTKAIEALKI